MLPKELVEEAAGGVKRKEGTADPGVVDGDVHGGQMSVGSVAWSTPSAAAPTSLLYMQSCEASGMVMSGVLLSRLMETCDRGFGRVTHTQYSLS